jgi:prolipoprotein diacylglyceryltransferase
MGIPTTILMGDWAVPVYLVCHALAVVVFVVLFLSGSPGRSATDEAGRAFQVMFMVAVLAGAWLGSWLAVTLRTGSWLAGGHSSLGALSGALAATVGMARFGRRDILQCLDGAAAPLAAADATARLGCLASGCCHGRPVWGLSWAVTYSPESSCLFVGIPVHPVPAYLSLGGFLLTGVLLAIRRRRFRPGMALSIFLMGIGGWRLACDPFRSQSAAGALGHPLLGLVAVVLLSCVFVLRLSHGKTLCPRLPRRNNPELRGPAAQPSIPA